MYKYLKKIQKSIPYIFKLIKDPRKKDVWRLIRYVQLQHLVNALRCFLNNESYFADMRSGILPQDINMLLDGLHSRCEKNSNDIYRWNFKGKNIFATQGQIYGVQLEYLAGVFQKIYSFDWDNRTVLDIGGYVGDSALYFLENGAKCVIIYEPVSINIEALNYNLDGFNERVQVHQKALSKTDEKFILRSSAPEGDMGFGSGSGGAYAITCQGICFRTLLKLHKVDVIKVDCEGAEVFLTELTAEELATIPYWIIETHTREIYEAVIQKFLASGFLIIREFSMNCMVDLVHFQYQGSLKSTK